MKEFGATGDDCAALAFRGRFSFKSVSVKLLDCALKEEYICLSLYFNYSDILKVSLIPCGFELKKLRYLKHEQHPGH